MLLDLFLACAAGPSDGPGADDTTSTVPDESYDCVAVDQWDPDGSVVPSGYEYCTVDAATGFYHRVEAIDVAIDPFGNPDDACFPEGMPAECKTNSDCEEGSICQSGGYFGGCECVAKCRTDDDCGTGAACIPNTPRVDKKLAPIGGSNQCVAASCLTDADCPSGWCVLDPGPCGSGFVGGLYCFSSKDECRTDSDCTDGKSCYSEGGPFICDYHSSCH